MRAYVEAYGCTLNFGESREIEDLLASRGWSIVRTPEDADLAVLSTCVVIEKTERAMLKRLDQLSSVPALVVTGCMARACREKAEAVVPKASFVGPGEVAQVGEIADAISPPERGVRPARPSYGIVPIASGCLGSCSYCITRLARGELRSRRSEGIVGTVKELVSPGPREVQLTAQDTAAYGADTGSSLPALVNEICEIHGDFRLRVGMMNPSSVLPRLHAIARIYAQPKVFKFLHLPIQSGSDGLLREMERGYTAEDFRRIVNEVRSVAPAVSLSTDIIVGYPGETDDDHALNMRVVSEVEPDIVNVTKFSARPGTKAATSEPKVVGWRVKDRSRELTGVRFKVARSRNEQWVGRKVRALPTELGKNRTTIFRTDEYKQIVVPGTHELGMFRNLMVTGATATYLRGELEDDS